MDKATATPVAERLSSLQQALNFDVLEPLQENDRFHVYRIRHEGEERVIKVAVQEELEENLERDVRMSMFLTSLGHANATTTYRVRDICNFGRGWFIGQYFDAPVLLAHREQEKPEKIMHVAKNIWAPFLAEAASYTPFFLQQRPFYISAQGMYTKDYYDRHDEVVRWAESARQKGLISQKEIRQILDYIEGNARVISTGLELIDVKPWDAFLLKGDKVGLVDLEYTTVTGRQSFDVAWSYLRFWADTHSEDAARAFLQSFMDHSVHDVRSFAPPFLTTLGMKLLGYLNDLAEYMDQAEQTGEKPPYSQEEMRRMLDAYLKFNVTALI